MMLKDKPKVDIARGPTGSHNKIYCIVSIKGSIRTALVVAKAKAFKDIAKGFPSLDKKCTHLYNRLHDI